MTTQKPPVALVTGAGSGMGLSTAQAFLSRGWTVLGLDIAPVEALSEEGQFISALVDVADGPAVDALVREHIPALGELRAVANVAGIYPPSTLETVTAELFRKVFDVNVLGVVNVMASAAPHMKSGTSIVNFASIDGYAVSPGQLIYGASKAAVMMITKATALELAPRGIRVNAIAPGWVSTPSTAATNRMAEAAASIPLGRVADPAEIAEWVWILSSPEASYMTGETVSLAGGYVLR